MSADLPQLAPPGDPIPRPLDEIIAAAIAVQANVVQLRTAQARRMNVDPADHSILTPSPGPVTRAREVLIERQRIVAYTDAELEWRLREVWGQFCLFCWALQLGDPNRPRPLAGGDAKPELRCPAALQLKAAEIEAFLWRLKFEQRVRHDPAYHDEPSFPQAQAVARTIPAKVLDQDVTESNLGDLIACSCEHAGMLAGIRWISDRRWTWGQDGIMDIDERSILDPANP